MANLVRWTRAEDDEMARYYSEIGVDGMLALLPGRTDKAIRQRAHGLGLSLSYPARGPKPRALPSSTPVPCPLPACSVDREQPLRWAL